MRILIAIHGYPPTNYAGAERAAERIVKWLVAHNHEVEVFAIERVDEPGFRVETKAENGFVIHRVFYDVKQNGNHFQNLYDFPPLGDALRTILAAKRFDLVHMVSGYLLGGQVIHTAREAGIPVVVTLTEYWFMCARLNLLQSNDSLCSGPESDDKCVRCLMEEKRRYRLPAQVAPGLMNAFWSVARSSPLTGEQSAGVARRRETLREALDAADLVISPSNFLISKFAEFGFDTQHYQFIRHGLDAIRHERPPRASKTGEDLKIGYLGQIKPHKGLDLLIDAALPLLDKEYKLSIDVWGPENEAPEYSADLKKRTAGYPSIHWNGRYEGSKVWDILTSFDVVAVPSRWYENSPTVILEAFSVGVPVITTRLGGMAELVEHGTSGLVFELNNPADLETQIERLLREPEMLDRLRSGIPRVKSGAEEVEEIFAQYQQVVRNRS